LANDIDPATIPNQSNPERSKCRDNLPQPAQSCRGTDFWHVPSQVETAALYLSREQIHSSVRCWNKRALDSMEMFPVFFKLQDRPCLVVGAGAIASPKISSLLRAGGAVTVVAPEAKSEVEAQARAGELQWHAREFVESDLEDMFLVIAATDLRQVNHQVAEAARSRNVLCNSVDDPPDCDFFYPSVVRRGELQIAISTAGKSPALAQRLREEVDALLPEDTGAWLDQLGETRLRILEMYPAGDERKQALHLLARRESCDPSACPVQQTLDRLIEAKIKGDRS